MTLGEKVKLRRTLLRINQLELSNQTGLSQAYISQIENGDRTDEADQERTVNKMELSEFIYKSRLCILDMQMLMLQTSSDESMLSFRRNLKNHRS